MNIRNKPLNHHLTHQLSSTHSPPLCSSCSTATFLVCYRRQCKRSLPFLYAGQTFPAPPHAPATASLIPATPGFIWFPESKVQRYGVGWGRLLSSKGPRSVQRVGGQLPHPCCSGSDAQAAFLPAATICLFTIVVRQQLKLSTKIELAAMHTVKTTSTPESLTSEIRW